MFLLVPAYPGCPGSKAVKRSLLLFISKLVFLLYDWDHAKLSMVDLFLTIYASYDAL